LPAETLFGDDAEADAFVYALYGDYCEGRVSIDVLANVLQLGNVYDDVIERTLLDAKKVIKGATVERVYIHLEAQSPPSDYRVYGARVVPFYNYFQAALCLFEEKRISALGLLRVAGELIREHRFDGHRLSRSYLELAQRGHLLGLDLDDLGAAVPDVALPAKARQALEVFVRESQRLTNAARSAAPSAAERASWGRNQPPYEELVLKHNRRHKK
jgi:hypothetical protein